MMRREVIYGNCDKTRYIPKTKRTVKTHKSYEVVARETPYLTLDSYFSYCDRNTFEFDIRYIRQTLQIS